MCNGGTLQNPKTADARLKNVCNHKYFAGVGVSPKLIRCWYFISFYGLVELDYALPLSEKDFPTCINVGFIIT